MSHKFEAGIFRNVPAWHGLGDVLQRSEAQVITPEEAAERVYPWGVRKVQLMTPQGQPAEGCYALQRLDNNQILNAVGKGYAVEQNSNLVVLARSLMHEQNLSVETAMVLDEGRIITMMLKGESIEVLGDTFKPYLSLCNYHGGGSRKVYWTAIREVCWNTHSASLRGAKNVWACRHNPGSLAITEANLEEARKILQLQDAKLNKLKEVAEKMYGVKFTEAKYKDLLRFLFPLEKEASKLRRDNVGVQREAFTQYAKAPDLENFKGTGWQMVQAATAYQSHFIGRKTKKEAENRFLDSLVGDLEARTLEFLAQV